MSWPRPLAALTCVTGSPVSACLSKKKIDCCCDMLMNNLCLLSRHFRLLRPTFHDKRRTFAALEDSHKLVRSVFNSAASFGFCGSGRGGCGCRISTSSSPTESISPLRQAKRDAARAAPAGSRGIPEPLCGRRALSFVICGCRSRWPSADALKILRPIPKNTFLR